MDSGPEGGHRYMSCTNGGSGSLQTAKGTDLCSKNDSTGDGRCYLETWRPVGAGQRTMVEKRGELMSASENCIGPNSFWTSQTHQLPPHPSERQCHTQATNDQAHGGQFG